MGISLNIDDMSTVARKKVLRFKINEGSQSFRILPPFGTNHNNCASREINLHWGFTTSDGNQRPIPCSYKTEGFCPICSRSREIESLANKAQANGDEARYKELSNEYLKLRNRRTFMYNAVDKQGNVCLLEVTKTVHDGLIALFKEYIKGYNLDPTSLTDGVWFNVVREGKGLKTKYTVNFKRIATKQDGEIIEKLDRSPLPENIVSSYETLAYDIHTMYKPLTASELQKILDGAPVDDVLRKGPKPQQSVSSDVEGEKVSPTPHLKMSDSELDDWTSILNE